MRTKASHIALTLLLAFTVATTVGSFFTIAADHGSYGLKVAWVHPSSGRQALTVTEVSPGTPAARAGLQPGDRIVAFAGFSDRIALTLQNLLPIHNYLAPNQPATFTVAHDGAQRVVHLIATRVPSQNRPLWLYELRLILYLLGAFIVGALVVARPSAITWGFALFVIFGQIAYADVLELAGLAGSSVLFLTAILVIYPLGALGTLGLVIFATRFPRPVARRGYALAERIAILLAALGAVAIVDANIRMLWGLPGPNAAYTESIKSLALSLIGIALLALTYFRSHGNDRVRLAWAILGPALGTLFIVTDHWAYAQGFEIAASSFGILASIAPFSMMYAILRHRVIDIQFPLARTFAQAVSEQGGARAERRDLPRRVALLLSADLPLQEIFAQVAALLAKFVDASYVFVAVGADSNARLAYAFADGIGRTPDDATIPEGSAMSAVVREGKARLILRAQEWPAPPVLTLGEADTDAVESAIFVPLSFGGAPIGWLCVQSRVVDAYDLDDVRLLETCALYLAARIRDEASSQRITRPAADLDGLTGLLNRPAFERALAQAANRRDNVRAALGLVLVDVDFFEAFGEAYGTTAADTCLRQIAGIVASKATRPADVAARSADDVFALLLATRDASDDIAIAEAIRSAVLALAVMHEGSSLGRLSVSLGIARPVEGAADATSLLDRARTNLEAAKLRGRNRVVGTDYCSEAEPAERRAVGNDRLPVPRGALHGRATEIAAIEAALARGGPVTIAGPMGSGKTRLALEVAKRSAARYPDGVWYLDCAEVKDAAAVPHRVGSALFADLKGDIDAARLSELLSERSALLLFDHFDHLSGACERLAALLAREGTQLGTLLATRDPANVAPESVYRLEPLSNEDGVALYLDRARGDGEGSLEPTPFAGRLVAKVRSNPLAIELLAALGPPAPELTQNEPWENPARTALGWTYATLDACEAAVFRRSAVFAGPFTHEAATAVCGANEFSPESVAQALGTLERHWLLHQSESEAGTLLPLRDAVREYAAERLRSDDDPQAARQRHQRYFAEYAKALVERKSTMPFAPWEGLQRAASENYRAALRHALRGSYDFASAAAIVRSLAGRLEAAAGPDLAADLRTAVGASDPGLDEQAAFWLALSELTRLDAPTDALRAARRALDLYRDVGDERGVAYATWQLSEAQIQARGELERSVEPALQAAIETARTIGDRQLAVGLLRNLAYLQGDEIRYDDARSTLREAADLVDRTDLAMLAQLVGSTALEEYREARFREAAGLWRRAAALAEEVSPAYAAVCLANAGASELSSGDAATARPVLLRGLSRLQRLGYRYGMTIALGYLAGLAKESGECERAARLAGFVEAFFERGSARPSTEQIQSVALADALRRALGRTAFEREHSRGYWMSLDEAVADAYAA